MVELFSCSQQNKFKESFSSEATSCYFLQRDPHCVWFKSGTVSYHVRNMNTTDQPKKSVVQSSFSREEQFSDLLFIGVYFFL